VSTDAGLEQEFNSLDAQREASEAYIKSQAHEGWRLIPATYDDGGFSGGTMERPALQRVLADVRTGQVDVILVYKVDRLTRSLAYIEAESRRFGSYAIRKLDFDRRSFRMIYIKAETGRYGSYIDHW